VTAPSLDSGAVLQDITSGDPHRIWMALGAIIQSRDEPALARIAARLPEIRSRTEGVELGGMLRSHKVSLNFALRKLEFYGAEHGCPCTLYPEHDLYDPEREQAAGNVRLLGPGPQAWGDAFQAECTRCGARYRAAVESYHYTWWQWSPDLAGETR
jgi:hypothetical protein